MTSIREIRLPAPHPDFRPRKEGTGRTYTHPGTAVRIGEDLFEVVSAQKIAGEWVYGLEPWDPGHVTRVTVEWGSGAEGAFMARLRTERIQAGKRTLALGGQVLIGFLPAKFQERLAQTLEFDPGRATLYSALLEIAVSLVPSFYFGLQLAGAAGRLGPFIPNWAGFLALIALAEGAVRFIINISSGDPVGSLALAILGLSLKKPKKEDVMSDDYALCGDTLEVRAPTPKAWWERAGGITYRGEPFILTASALERTTHVYRFRKGSSGFPEADPVMERELNIASDRAYALAPLWGFLPRRDQEKIESYGRYRPRTYVLFSVAFNLLLSGSIVATDMFRIAAGIFGPWNILRFAFAVVLFGESIVRLLRWLQNSEVSGSFLGVLVKPVYYLAVEAGPSGAAKPAPSQAGKGSSSR